MGGTPAVGSGHVALINNSFPSLYLVSPWQLKIFDLKPGSALSIFKQKSTTQPDANVLFAARWYQTNALPWCNHSQLKLYSNRLRKSIYCHMNIFFNLSGAAQQFPKEETVIYPIYWVWHRCYLSSEEIDVFKEMVLLAKYGAGFFFGQGMWHYIPLYTQMVLPSNNDKNWIWRERYLFSRDMLFCNKLRFRFCNNIFLWLKQMTEAWWWFDNGTCICLRK